MWRPENWIKIRDDLINENTEGIRNAIPCCYPLIEAVADALLSALKKQGMYCYPHKFQSLNGEPVWTKGGWQVFIEEGK